MEENGSDKKFYGSANMFASVGSYPEQANGQLNAAKSNHGLIDLQSVG